MTETPAPTEQEKWTCVGMTILRSQLKAGATDYELARRNSDGAFAIVKLIGKEWVLHGPVCTLASALKVAEHVAAGDSRALTWPETPLMLATAVLAFVAIAKETPTPAPAPAAPLGEG